MPTSCITTVYDVFTIILLFLVLIDGVGLLIIDRPVVVVLWDNRLMLLRDNCLILLMSRVLDRD